MYAYVGLLFALVERTLVCSAWWSAACALRCPALFWSFRRRARGLRALHADTARWFDVLQRADIALLLEMLLGLPDVEIRDVGRQRASSVWPWGPKRNSSCRCCICVLCPKTFWAAQKTTLLWCSIGHLHQSRCLKTKFQQRRPTASWIVITPVNTVEYHMCALL
jgi:hypothetical protein